MVNIALAVVAQTGGGDFGPRRIQPNCYEYESGHLIMA